MSCHRFSLLAKLQTMSTLAPLFEAWDEAHREFAIALGNFPDEDLWKRPHPRLLSVGELAGHVAYGEASWTMGGGHEKPDLDQISVKSPLLNRAFRYYASNVEHPFQVELNAVQVLEEIKRIHDAAKEALAETGKDDSHPYWHTWGNLIQYQVFHVAYHTGQIYSVRHLLGHETEDN
jgi:uncharacterized damage-inducible protein DinB